MFRKEIRHEITVGGKTTKLFHKVWIDGKVYKVNKRGEWIKIMPIKKKWYEFWR